MSANIPTIHPTHRKATPPTKLAEVGWGNPSPLRLRFVPEVELTNELFWKLCAANPDLSLERTAEGDLEIMSPVGSDSARRNNELSYQLTHWSKTLGRGLGVCFDSSVGFLFPDGSTRGPDASWIARDRWDALPPEQREVFAPICPDFVAELRSPSNDKADLRDKMQDYITNGARLGWLIDPIDQTVEIYRPNREPEILRQPETLDGEDVLPGFVLDLKGILYEY